MPKILISTKDLSHEEWLKWRAKGIGGSDASVVCGLNRYKSPVELWMEKTGQIEPKAAGEAAHWGTMLEPLIRNEFTERTGLQIKQEHAILQHSEYPFMLANLDGIVSDPLNGDCVFEAKTANAFKSDDWVDQMEKPNWIL
jgi:putative phage-type endonuclease